MSSSKEIAALKRATKGGTPKDAEYITSSHKKIFLRFITVQSSFLKGPGKFPEYVSIMTYDLNALGIVRNEREWLKIMDLWASSIEAELGASEKSVILSNEDERLQEYIRQKKNWIEPTYSELSCIVDNLEELGDFPSLWKAVAAKFHRTNSENPSDFEYWRNVYYQITNTISAKKDLIDHIETNHSNVQFRTPQLCSLSKIETRVLRLKSQLNIPLNQIAKDVNIPSHCRICLASSSPQMNHLFSPKTTDVPSILEKLNFCSCTKSAPQKGDGFPEYICMSCAVLLESAYQLKMLCSKTESKLMGVVVKATKINEYPVAVEDLPKIEPKERNEQEIINEMFEVDESQEEYKQIELIDTMEISEDDGSKKIYLVTSDGPNDEEQTELIYEINELENDEMDHEEEDNEEGEQEEDLKNDLYEIVETASIESADEENLNEIEDQKTPIPVSDSANLEFQCENCGLAYQDASALKLHMKSHGSPRRHECSDCKKVFKTRLSLTIHMRSHTGERPYVCETCGKAFKTVSAVNNHRAIHSDVKEFNCPHCPYSASTKANLKIHDRTHSGVQPYACRYCPLKFSTASNMHKHMRNIHEKLKTNKCDQCGRSFFTRESARKHMVTHTGLKPYTCTQCPMSYGWYNGLKKHVKMQHANIKIPTETTFFKRLKKS